MAGSPPVLVRVFGIASESFTVVLTGFILIRSVCRATHIVVEEPGGNTTLRYRSGVDAPLRRFVGPTALAAVGIACTLRGRPGLLSAVVRGRHRPHHDHRRSGRQRPGGHRTAFGVHDTDQLIGLGRRWPASQFTRMVTVVGAGRYLGKPAIEQLRVGSDNGVSHQPRSTRLDREGTSSADAYWACQPSAWPSRSFPPMRSSAPAATHAP